MYPISEKAVRNWIAAAKEGKLELALYEKGDKTYIANTSQNAAIIEKLVEERRKFVNTRGRKAVRPRERFYELLNKDQIFDVITHLETHNEIPLKYSYFEEGAGFWDKYSQKLATEEMPNILNQTVELLEINTDYLLYLVNTYDKINVIDIGPGNGQPVKGFLENLLKKNKLNRYIALDISQSMLDKLEQNTTKWFGQDFPFEGYIKDIAHDRFKDVLGEDAVGGKDNNVCNIVLLLGCTLANFRSPSDSLRLIYNSIGANSLLVYSLMLDSDKTKRYFDFSISATTQKTGKVSLRTLLMVDYLGIDSSLYDLEQFFDDERNRRVGQIRLKAAVDIEFQVSDFARKVHFNKGDVIELWSNRHQTADEVIDELDQCGFSMLQSSQTIDHEYILVISRVKKR